MWRSGMEEQDGKKGESVRSVGRHRLRLFSRRGLQAARTYGATENTFRDCLPPPPRSRGWRAARQRGTMGGGEGGGHGVPTQTRPCKGREGRGGGRSVAERGSQPGVFQSLTGARARRRSDSRQATGTQKRLALAFVL